MKDGFDRDYLDDIQPSATVETVRRELKARLYHIGSGEWEGQAEIVRDAIALANTARTTASPCYLIMGMTEGCAIVDQAYEGVTPGIAAKSTLEERMNANENALLQHLNNYIEPTLNVEFQWGRYERRDAGDDGSGVGSAGIVAYLVFRFQPVEPFRVKRKLVPREDNKVLLEPDDTWTRYGASKGRKLSIKNQSDLALLWSHLDRPYIDNRQWLSYASSQPRFETPLEYYSLRGRFGAHEQDALAFLENWLTRGKATFLYLHGGIGSGKSLLVNQFHDALLQLLMDRLFDQDRDADVEITIPILLNLNGCSFEKESDFADYVLNRLNFYGDLSEPLAHAPANAREASTWKRAILTDPRRRFLLIIDSLDELDTRKTPWRESFLSIRDFVDRSQGRVKAILAGRTGTISRGVLSRDWEELELLPLRRQDVEAVMEARSLDAQVAFRSLLAQEPELWQYVGKPLAFQAVVELIDDLFARWPLETPFAMEIGMVLDEIVTVMLRHESAKDLSDDRDSARRERRKRYASLAWKLDGKRERLPLTELAREFDNDNSEIKRAEQLAVLEPWRDSAYQFTSPLLKAYFAALYARNAAQSVTVDWTVELAHASREVSFWNRCGTVLQALIWDQFEATALAPLYQFIRECGQAHFLLQPSPQARRE